MARIFITGTAGFIGFHLARLLLEQGHRVHGYDALTDYYDVALKQARRDILLGMEGYTDTIAMLELEIPEQLWSSLAEEGLLASPVELSEQPNSGVAS